MALIKTQSLNDRLIGDNQILIKSDGTIELAPSSGNINITGNLAVTGDSPGPKNASVYYVSTEGNDSNSGLSSDAAGAKRTIKDAIDSAPENAIIHVAPGDYYEDNPITLKPKQTLQGASLRTTRVWPNNNTQDLFYLDNGTYVSQLTFRGLRDPAYCFKIKQDAIVTSSPYVQNCTNMNGPWLNDGTEFIPFETVQIEGVIPTAKPIINNANVPTAKRVNENGGGNGIYVDGDAYSTQSLIKSILADSFTQIAQGGIGFHATNTGYIQAVSCFTVFARIGFQATNGGYLLVSNSLSDFGTYGILADGNYSESYTTARTTQNYYSSIGGIEVTNVGADYTVDPTVTIDAPTGIGGVQAVASAVRDAVAGTIVAINVTNAGSGYETVPNVTITGGGTPSVTATATAVLNPNTSVEVNSLRDVPRLGSIITFTGDATEYFIVGTSETTPPFRYDESVCRRDLQYVIDAVMGDIALETDYQSLAAARSYLRATASKVTSQQLDPTVYALEQTRDQIIPLVTVGSQTNVTNNFALIINTITQGDSTSLPDITYADLATVDAGTIQSKNNIVANRDFIIQEVTRYISEQFAGLTYDQTKCERDVGYIIDAIDRDIRVDTNHNSITAGLAYRRATANVVDQDQLASTILSVRHLRDEILDIFEDNATATSRATDRFEVLLDALEYGATPSEGTVYNSPVGAAQTLIDAARQLQDNRQFLIAEIIAYINVTYPALTYDQAKCERDTGYIVDAVTHDLLYNGNKATQIAARAYVNNGSTQVPGQQTETADAIAHLASVAGQVIEGIMVTKSAGNAETQSQFGGFGTAAENTTADGLFQIVEDVVTTGLSALPPEVNIDTSWVDTSLNEIADTLLDSTSTLQASVINYITNTIQAFTYDVDLCERDTGYIVDAAVYDMMYGGNKQTRRAAEAYFSFGATVIESQEGFSEFAYKFLANLLRTVALNEEADFLTASFFQQVFDAAGSNASADNIKLLVDKIAEVIQQGSTTFLPVELNHDYATLSDPTLLGDRNTVLASADTIEDESIRLLNLTYGGVYTLEITPGVVTVLDNTLSNLNVVSTVNTSSHAFEYVGAGVTFNALPEFGGNPVPANRTQETNGGKAFISGTVDQIGTFDVGNLLSVNALTGAVTFNSTDLTFSGVSSIGPFRRNQVEVGKELKEVSDNISMISSLGTTDNETVPTQSAVVGYVSNQIAAIESTVGTPTDGTWDDGAYLGIETTDLIKDVLDDLNESIENVRNNTFVRDVSFTSTPTSGGEGTTVTLSLTVDGNANRYDIDWGDSNQTNNTTDSTPSHTYTSNAGSPYTVTVRAFNNTAISGTSGSEATAINTDYIIIYTADPVVSFQLFDVATGGSALSGNDLYVIEGNSLYMENNTTNTSMASVTYEMDWGDGSANDTIASDAADGGVSGSRLEHPWDGGTNSGSGTDTLTLTLDSHTTADPAVIPASASLQLKVYDPNIINPEELSTKTIAFDSSTGISPKLASGVTDNTAGTTLVAGDDVDRTTLTVGTIDSTTLSTFAWDASGGILGAVVNGVIDGQRTMTSGDDSGTYTSLVITEESDYNLLDASGSSIPFSSSIYYPGLYTGFKAKVASTASGIAVGINSFQLAHSTAGDSNAIEFVKDDLTANPTVTSGTISETTGNYRYISGIPYYTTGSAISVNGATINNWIGKTYRDTATPATISSGTNLEGTSASAITTATFTYAQLEGGVTYLTGGIPDADTGNGSAYTVANLAVNITSSSVRTIERIQMSVDNVNGSGSDENSTILQVHTAAQSNIDETAIDVSASLGSGTTDDGVRIFDFSADTTDTPSYSGATNFYTNNPYTESADPGVAGTKEATLRLGNIEHNVINYSAGYLPAGPNRSADTGTQYFTFAFRRTVVSNFDINITSATGVSGVFIAAPGTGIDTSSSLNGWLDCSLQYSGSGQPGANTGSGGNGSNGCAVNGGDIIAASTALSGSYTMTLGTESLTNATGNVALIRIALASGQSVTSLSIS